MINVPGSREAVLEYLAQTGEEVDEFDVFNTALALVVDSDNLKDKLKHHTSIVLANLNQMAYVQEYLDLITQISQSLHYELMLKRLYVRGKLPYLCEQVFGSKLLLCTREVYVNRLLNEFRNEQTHCF